MTALLFIIIYGVVMVHVGYAIGHREAKPVHIEPITWTASDVPAVWRRNGR